MDRWCGQHRGFVEMRGHPHGLALGSAGDAQRTDLGRVYGSSTGPELIGDLDWDMLERFLPKAGKGGPIEPRQQAATAIAARPGALRCQGNFF
jgi:hypothetical protein